MAGVSVAGENRDMPIGECARDPENGHADGQVREMRQMGLPAWPAVVCHRAGKRGYMGDDHNMPESGERKWQHFTNRSGGFLSQLRHFPQRLISGESLKVPYGVPVRGIDDSVMTVTCPCVRPTPVADETDTTSERDDALSIQMMEVLV